MLLAAERSSRTPAQSLKCFVAPADFASQRESGWLESAWGTSWCCRNGAGRWCGADRRIADPVGAAADERCTSAASHGKPAAGGTSCRGPRDPCCGRTSGAPGLELRRRAGRCSVVQHDQGGGGSARASAGRPAHPAGAVAVCNRARDRQCPRTGAAVRGAYRLPVAVRWRRHERQDAGGLPGGAWRGAGAVAGRQLHRVAEDRRGEAGSRRPGWRAGACRCRGGVVPPAQHVGGLPAGGGSAGAAAARHRAADDRARRVKQALAVTETLQAQQREQAHQRAEREARKAALAQPDEAKPIPPKPEAEKEPRASTTDAEARVMKMADGGFRPAYNVQFASDTTSGAIAGVAVDNSGSDMGKMAPMSEALGEHYGQRPGEHLADGGYAKLDDIKALAEAGVTAYVPVPTPRDKTRDRHAPQQADAPAIADWRERMGTEQAKEIYKERAATAECSNAQARNRGLRQFVVRGLDKVRNIAVWHALTHNMVCGWRLAAG